MGWNHVQFQKSSPLFQNLREQEFFYFVHSFRAPIVSNTIGVTQYGEEFSAAVQHGNYYGVQFHAEKSGNAGLQVLKNFLELC